MNIEEKIKQESYHLMTVYYYDYYYAKKSWTKFDDFSKKFYKYFESTVRLFINEEMYSAELFLKCILADEFKYPTQLPNEKNREIFREYRNYLKEEKKSESKELKLAKVLAENIIWMNGKTVKEVLENPLYMKEIEKDFSQELDKEELKTEGNIRTKIFFKGLKKYPLLAFSKTFIEYNSDLDFEVFQKPFLNYKKVMNKIKEKLAEDFLMV